MSRFASQTCLTSLTPVFLFGTKGTSAQQNLQTLCLQRRTKSGKRKEDTSGTVLSLEGDTWRLPRRKMFDCNLKLKQKGKYGKIVIAKFHAIGFSTPFVIFLPEKFAIGFKMHHWDISQKVIATYIKVYEWVHELNKFEIRNGIRGRISGNLLICHKII